MDEDEVLRLWRGGMSYGRIATRFGVKPNSVGNVIRSRVSEEERAEVNKRNANLAAKSRQARDFVEHREQEVSTWAGAFRRLADFCACHGYEDAWEFARGVAREKDMRL